uniref:uncharacterized protein LOC120348628 n=1 Tax=Styela clava TaxID=7725 RepID=UPI001939F380|nr:uncharacterized protein LOC120348628 [Styela clava]
MQKLFAFSLIVAAICHLGLGLTCYSCFNCQSVDSSHEEVCLDITGLTTMCIKSENSALGITAVNRACGYGTSTNCSSGTLLGITGTVCYCDTDLCNGAVVVRISVIMGTLITGILARILM